MRRHNATKGTAEYKYEYVQHVLSHTNRPLSQPDHSQSTPLGPGAELLPQATEIDRKFDTKKGPPQALRIGTRCGPG